MLPLTARFFFEENGKKKFGFRVPLFLIWSFLLLCFVIFLPVLIVVLLITKKSHEVITFIAVSYKMIASLKGLSIDIREKGTNLQIIIT